MPLATLPQKTNSPTKPDAPLTPPWCEQAPCLPIDGDAHPSEQTAAGTRVCPPMNTPMPTIQPTIWCAFIMVTASKVDRRSHRSTRRDERSRLPSLRHTECLIHAAEVTIHEVECHHRRMVLQFFRECTSQSCESTYRHTHREVPALDVTSVPKLRFNMSSSAVAIVRSTESSHVRKAASTRSGTISGRPKVCQE